MLCLQRHIKGSLGNVYLTSRAQLWGQAIVYTFGLVLCLLAVVFAEELLSIGSIGLIKAIDTFDHSNGARLATYAARCIQNEILMYFRSQKKQSLEVSIDEAIDIDREGNPLTYIDIIKCDDTIADDLDRRLSAERAMEYIREKLSEREKCIMIMRYGLDGSDPLTQRECAEALGISRSYVSRIEKGVLTSLKEYLG